MLTFPVYGTSVPQGSHKGYVRGGKVVITDANLNLRPWRDRVMLAAREAIGQDWEPLTGPVRVTLQFHLPRPASAPKTRDIRPTKKPDIEKLVRSIHDSLTDAGVWKDDSQVVSLLTDKFYAVSPDLTRIHNPTIHQSTPCVWIILEEIPDAR